MKNSFLTKLNLFIRSLIFNLFLPIVTIFYSFFSVCMFPFPLRYRYAVIMAWTSMMVWVLKKVCHIDYEVKGLENIPKNRNAIIMSKHQSTWETFFLPTLFYQCAIILKRELLWVPFFGWGLATIDPIAINRKAGTTAMDQIIAQGRRCLEAGRFILVFPEGTRIAPGKVGKYRLGGARLSATTGYPIIPIAHNAGYFWRKRGFIKYPGTIQVVIGPLIEPNHRKPEEIIKEVKTWIEDMVKEMR